MIAPNATTTAAPIQPQRTLNALDRCDRCGAQAYHAAELDSPSGGAPSELLWCNHHFEKYKLDLMAAGFKFTANEAGRLRENRLQGADHA